MTVDREFARDRFFPALGSVVGAILVNRAALTYFFDHPASEAPAVLVGRVIGAVVGSLIGTVLLAAIGWGIGLGIAGGLGRRHFQKAWIWTCLVYLAIWVCEAGYLQFNSQPTEWSWSRVLGLFYAPIQLGWYALRLLNEGYAALKVKWATKQHQQEQVRQAREAQNAPFRNRAAPIVRAGGWASWLAGTSAIAVTVTHEEGRWFFTVLGALVAVIPALLVVMALERLLPWFFRRNPPKKVAASRHPSGPDRQSTEAPRVRFRTHYDNLQVAETASEEVIKGAYRHLSQKYHPDKNPDRRAEAERITKVLNEAYAVLSDPLRRREHDEWIRRQRARA